MYSAGLKLVLQIYRLVPPPRHPRGTAGKGSSGFLEKGNSRPAARYRDRNGKIYVRRDRPPISVSAEKNSIAVTLHEIHPLF